MYLKMKTIFILLFLTFNLPLLAQSEKYIGNYEIRFDTKNAVIEYKLKLNPDGTFLFHSYSNHIMKLSPEEHIYGRGTWSSKKKTLSFYTNKENDFDETYTIDLINSKARFISKSPRDKSDREIKIALKFFESEIPWIKGLDLYKNIE
ncbi:MAG: hypothetical protein ACI9SJ_000500 [Flavobacteriaceae bacterium]|jgi:hypothetical protein